MQFPWSKVKFNTYIPVWKEGVKGYALGWIGQGENFPTSILTMFYGWRNASGLAFIKGKKSKKTDPAKVGWYWNFKLDIAPGQ